MATCGFIGGLFHSTFVQPRLSSRKGRSACTTRIVHMSSRREPRKENVPGSLYVDHTCIDCDTCRWFQPEFFTRRNGMSAVYNQPKNPKERAEALKAVIACPTGSISLRDSTREEREKAMDSFPQPVEGLKSIYYLYPSRHTFGGASYLIFRDNGESVMFDSPRWSERLAKGIEKLTGKGGVKYLVLSHKDDVAAHDKWAKRLNCERVIHSTDVTRSQGTTSCEVQLKGSDFGKDELEWWDLGVQGLKITSVRGHTRGSIVMLDSVTQTLFTGDHVYGRITGRLGAGSRYCQDSWQKQIDNVARLEKVPFRAVLPGHGRPVFWSTDQEKINAIRGAVGDMQREGVLVGRF